MAFCGPNILISIPGQYFSYPRSSSITLKMAAAIYAEMLKLFQQTERLKHES
jgi:hypothetical protein